MDYSPNVHEYSDIKCGTYGLVVILPSLREPRISAIRISDAGQGRLTKRLIFKK